MREYLLQAKNIRGMFTSYSFSSKIGFKNTVTISDVQISLPLDMRIRPGDELEVVGSFDGGLQSLYSGNLSLTSRTIHIKRQGSSYGFPSFFFLLSHLEEFPQVISRRLSSVLEPSQAALLVGIVFGGSSNLPKSLLQDTRITGLIHITSASGYNVALLVGFSLTLFTRFFHRRIAALLCLITVIIYCTMTGFSPPILRAALMSGLYLVSLSLGRSYHARWSLWVSGILILIYQPFIIFSPSFLLSYTATAGVLYQDVFWKKGKRTDTSERIFRQIWEVLEENLMTSISAMVFSTPIILYFFGIFSLVGVVANALLLWLVSPLMYAGLIMCFLVLIPGVLSALFAVPVSLALEVFIRLVHLFASLPLASLAISKPSLFGVILWYICLGAYIFWKVAKE